MHIVLSLVPILIHNRAIHKFVNSINEQMYPSKMVKSSNGRNTTETMQFLEDAKKTSKRRLNSREKLQITNRDGQNKNKKRRILSVLIWQRWTVRILIFVANNFQFNDVQQSWWTCGSEGVRIIDYWVVNGRGVGESQCLPGG